MKVLAVYRSSHQRCSVRKGVHRNFTKFTGKHLCQSLLFNKACNFIKKETLAQVFSCEFCEIFKNTFLHRTPLVAASVCVICTILDIHCNGYIFKKNFKCERIVNLNRISNVRQVWEALILICLMPV